MTKINRRIMRENSMLTEDQKSLLVPFVKEANVKYNNVDVETMSKAEILEMFYEFLHTAFAEVKILSMTDDDFDRLPQGIKNQVLIL